jgi:RNA polymerase sigma factor (TIGR02999 family)
VAIRDQEHGRDAERIAAMVERADAGDAEARNALFASLYAELHHLAESHLRRSHGQLTIGATTLLHEAYLDLNGRSSVTFPDHLRFLKYASRAMRGLLIDYLRTKRAQKRGGEITFVSLSPDEVGAPGVASQVERLGQELEELEKLDPGLAELVDLKFFCGFSFGEIAAMRRVSERTVQRDWAKARMLLHDALQNGPLSGSAD